MHPVVRRIPEDLPLVLRPRLSRFLTMFGAIYLGLPIVLALICGGALVAMVGADRAWPFVAILVAVLLGLGLLQLALVTAMGMSGGPYLAADDAGIWIRARKVPARAVFLPWPAVARVYPRRWLFDRIICVLARDPRTGEEAGRMARIDMRWSKMISGSRLTASTFFCRRRADDVLAKLSRLSAGRTFVG